MIKRQALVPNRSSCMQKKWPLSASSSLASLTSSTRPLVRFRAPTASSPVHDRLTDWEICLSNYTI
jgi:hypothetical protein